MKKNKLYVSLPITGHTDDEVKARCEAAKAKYSKGFTVVTPWDVVEDKSAPYSLCMGKCIEALLECQAAVFLSGWEHNRECSVERHTCDVYGIVVLLDSRL